MTGNHTTQGSDAHVLPDPCSPARRLLCAHADRDGAGLHWLEPGQQCPGADDADRHGTAETAP